MQLKILNLLEDDKVKAFVGEYNPENYLLNRENPIAVGPLDLSHIALNTRDNRHKA